MLGCKEKQVMPHIPGDLLDLQVHVPPTCVATALI